MTRTPPPPDHAVPARTTPVHAPTDRTPTDRTLRTVELVGFDVVVAAVLAVVCVFAAIDGPEASAVGPVWLSWLVGLAVGLPVAVRRRFPVAVTLIVLAVGSAALVSGIIPDFASAAPMVVLAFALYSVGVETPRRRSIVVAAGSIAVTAASIVLASMMLRHNPDSTGVALSSLVAVLAWYVGRAARDRRANSARAAAERIERAVTEERLRIARELHDIVAHTMSVIAVKAAIANHVADDRPQETREALRVIETTSREALAEMRRTFGALRGAGAADLAPLPGLAQLPELAQRAQSAGVRVTLTITPPQAAVPEGLGLTVYRIVQEALTNVVRHASRPVRCEALVRVSPDHVQVSVSDDGASTGDHPVSGGQPDGAGQGQGIIGMRERVHGCGGEFVAGRKPDGGFTVTARLPLLADAS